MNRIITISREYGAGGHSIGRRVAEELGIPFYDRDIVKQTVKASGYDLDMVEHDEEDATRTGFSSRVSALFLTPRFPTRRTPSMRCRAR